MAERASKDLTMKDAIQSTENSNALYGEHQQKNINKLLTMKIKDANGKSSDMFAVETNDSQRYCCLLCSTNNMGLLKLISHAGSKAHKLKLHKVDEHSSSNQRIGVSVKMASELQARLNKITDQVMIGVEYMIEVSFGDTFEPIFHCVLCEGKFDLQVVIHHLTSYVHRLNYLEKNFPTAFKKVSAMEKREQKYNFLEQICQSIEGHYGRLLVKVVQSDEFAASQAICYESILNAKHIDEKMGRTFTEVMDFNRSNGLSPVSEFDEANSTCGLESISTSSEFEMSPYKTSDKVLLRPRSSLCQTHKMNLSPTSPEKTGAFDEELRSRKSLFELSTHESKRHSNETITNDKSSMTWKHRDVKSPKSSSSGSYGRKNRKHSDEKCSSRVVEKSPKRKCSRKKVHRAHTEESTKSDLSRSPPGYREKYHKPHAGVVQNRDRSRSPQGHRTLLKRSYRQSPADYGNTKNYDYFESKRNSTQSSGRSASTLFKPSQEIPNRADYLLSYDGRYNHPMGTVTAKEFRKGYRSVPASIEWNINGRQFALNRPSNRPNYALIYNAGCNYNHPTRAIPTYVSGGYNNNSCPVEKMPTSMDYGEYVVSRPHRERIDRTDCLLPYSGGFNHSKETVIDQEFSKDYIPTSIEPNIDDGEPITIISVLSLLSAFENFLGSLGPKMIELMTEAIAMESIGVNFSNRILDDMNHCILFETTKEKLKGLLSAGIVEKNKIMAMKRTIKHMDVLIDEAMARKRLDSNRSDTTECSNVASPSQIAEKILLAINEHGKADISKVQLAQYVDQYISLASVKQYDDDHGSKSATDKEVCESYRECKNKDLIIANSQTKHIYEKTEATTNANKNSSTLADSITTDTQPKKSYEKANPIADTNDTNLSAFEVIPSTTLSDSNLTTLIKNFDILSDTEKQEVITNIRDIERHEPERMERLRNQLEIKRFPNFNFESSELADEKTLVRMRFKSETEEF